MLLRNQEAESPLSWSVVENVLLDTAGTGDSFIKC